MSRFYGSLCIMRLKDIEFRYTLHSCSDLRFGDTFCDTVYNVRLILRFVCIPQRVGCGC